MINANKPQIAIEAKREFIKQVDKAAQERIFPNYKMAIDFMSHRAQQKPFSKLGIVSVFAALGAVKVWQQTQEKPNPETNCYKHISGKMAILIDKTDIIPPQTQTEIAARALAAINEHSKMGDLISVYEITQDSLTTLKPSFKCVAQIRK
jgi:hypothetical protein